MTDPTRARLPNGVPAELTKALVSLWTQYAGKRPNSARTDVRGNVVTCVLVDAVGDYNKSMIAPQTPDTAQGMGKLTQAGYKREAVATVVRLTRQRVASFVSSHDQDTDVATEVFTLEPSLSRGAPRAERRFRHASWLPSPRARGRTWAMDSGTRDSSKGKNLRLVALEAEALHARDRYQLYRAKAYGPRLTRFGRLRELERQSKLADSRLDRAKADQDQPAPGEGSGIDGPGR